MPRFWVTVRRQRVVQETAELWIEAESEHAAEDIALVMEDEAGLDFKDSDDIPDWQNIEIEVLPDDTQIKEPGTE